MHSTPAKTRHGGVRRMLLATIALTLLYIALQEVLVNSLAALYSHGLISTDFKRGLDEEARQVAESSAAREGTLTPRHRFAAWALGLYLGSASQYLGSYGASEPGVRQRARAAAAPHLASAQQHADFLGIGAVAPLESSTAAQFSDLNARIDADEGGIGARIAERTTLRHRHLFFLGMHVGRALRALQSEYGSGPASAQIARHATLAGLAREHWEPLARTPRGGTRAEIAASYQAAAEAAEKAIVAAAPAPKS